MELLINISLFCLALVGLIILIVGFEIALGVYEQHKINKIYHQYIKMCEDESYYLERESKD